MGLALSFKGYDDVLARVLVSLRITLLSSITPMWVAIKVHMILRSFVVLTWMSDTKELVEHRVFCHPLCCRVLLLGIYDDVVLARVLVSLRITLFPSITPVWQSKRT